MLMETYQEELKECNLCEWKCGVNRLEGEMGVCMVGKPKVASTTLHPAPPQSYTVFMAGCNFRCLNCQNWNIAHRPERPRSLRGYIEPEELAQEAVLKIGSRRGKMIGADRVFFSGGSPTPNLPYIERVVEESKKIGDNKGKGKGMEVRVNYDTNGFLTEESLERVLDFTTSITFDIKAFDGELHRALTGAPVQPVLRNARKTIEDAKDRLWEIRYLLIPGVNEEDVRPLAEFLEGIDETVPLNFLAFRPNFILEDLRGVKIKELEKAVETAEDVGLTNVGWSGRPGLTAQIDPKEGIFSDTEGTEIAQEIAEEKGCVRTSQDCGSCLENKDCSIKLYRPEKDR